MKRSLAQKRRVAEKLPPLGNLETEFSAGFEALTGKGGNSGIALEILGALAERYPDYYEIRNNLAVAYFQNGQPEKARELLAGIHSIPHNRAILDYNVEFLKENTAASRV